MAAPRIDSEVSVLKTKSAAKKGLGTTPSNTETTWPKPQFGPSTTIDNITDASAASGFTVPAGSMFVLGAALPTGTVLQHGMYFPAGTMFPNGVLCPIHQRMMSVQPLPTSKPAAPSAEAVCILQ